MLLLLHLQILFICEMLLKVLLLNSSRLALMMDVTSIRWAPDRRHLSVGLNNSHVQLWDSLVGKMVSVCF
jgi:hypothetical protein